MIGYVIEAPTEWGSKKISQVFEKRTIAKEVLEKYSKTYNKFGKAKIKRWTYEKAKPMSEEDRKWAEQFSKNINQALREVMK